MRMTNILAGRDVSSLNLKLVMMCADVNIDWARSFLGVSPADPFSHVSISGLISQYPPVREAKPNPTHIYIAALSALSLAPNLITQNVSPSLVHLIINTSSYLARQFSTWC